MKIKYNGLKTKKRDFDRPKPYFLMHKTRTDMLKDLEKDFENLVIIGNGGSVTSFRALNYAFRDQNSKNVEIVTTMEPGYLKHLDHSLKTDETLVMPISKSGNTTGVIESTLFFMDKGYEIMPLTSKEGLLHDIAEEKGLEMIKHPDIGGRYTGLSETALAPAALLGLDVEQLFEKGREAQKSYWNEDQAIKMASALQNAEEQGYTEVMTAFYSTRLFGFYPLMVQLMHESVCKKGEGQTFYGDLGPEFQHHTNQRIFGGKQNVLPIFIESSHEHSEISIPEDLEDFNLRGRKLGDLNGKSLEKSLRAEAEGVKQALDQENRPYIKIDIGSMNYGNVADFIAFLQFLAVYSGWMRGVNPFNQPDVEKSKELGFEERFNGE